MNSPISSGHTKILKMQTEATTSNDSSFAFVFLYIYSILVLVRPQDFFLPLLGLPIVMVTTILCLLAALTIQRPLHWLQQHTMVLMLLPIVSVSALLNGWGTKGLVESQDLLVSIVFPLFLFTTILSTGSRQRKIMVVSIFASILMVHNGWVQFNSYDGFGWTGTQAVGGDLRRIVYVGIFEDPNDLGMLLVMNMSFLAYFYNRGGFVLKLICLNILAVFLYGVYMTGSRGTLLGTSALIGFYLLLKYGGTRMVIAGIVLGPVVATLLSKFGGLSSGEASARGRLEAWYEGIQYLLGNPIWGIGKGNFADWHGLTAHNSYILVAAELGFFGYTLWGGAIAFTVYIGYKVFKLPLDRFADNPHKELIIDEIKLNTALFFSMISYIVTSFFLSRSYILLLFIFIGMSAASHFRVSKFIPELRELITYKTAFYCSLASWIMIFMVYLTLKVGL